MKEKITRERIEKYRRLTSSALELAKKSIIEGRENHAREIIEMVSNYLSDSEYFKKDGDFVNAFAALNYAHGWLDAGIRLDVFDVKNDKFFTVK